jgi:hypothetical protein
MPGGSESTTAAVRRALELGTTAVQEVRTAAAEEQRKALKALQESQLETPF